VIMRIHLYGPGKYQGLPARRRVGDGVGLQVSFPVVCDAVVVAYEP
jgi:hypothetical protein